MLQVYSTSTEMAGIHGTAVDALPVSTMPAADPVHSEQKGNTGELDLGHRSIADQRK